MLKKMSFVFLSSFFLFAFFIPVHAKNTPAPVTPNPAVEQSISEKQMNEKMTEAANEVGKITKDVKDILHAVAYIIVLFGAAYTVMAINKDDSGSKERGVFMISIGLALWFINQLNVI